MIMSKNKQVKKPKQKATAFDIVYRVVTALIGIAIFPLVYFLKLLYLEVSSLNLLGGGKPSTTYFEVGIADVVSGDYAPMFDSLSAGNEGYFSGLLSLDMYKPVIVSAIFLILALIIVAIIVVFAILSSKAKPVVYLSVAGLVSTIVSYFCFNQLFAAKALAEGYTLADFLNTSDYLSNLIFGTLVGSVTNIHLCEAFSAVFFGLVAILIWSLAVHIVNYGEDKEAQKEREAKKAVKEAKKTAKDAKKAAKEAEEIAKDAEKAAKEAKKAAKEAVKAAKEVKESQEETNE